jgi:hypothetical protein
MYRLQGCVLSPQKTHFHWYKFSPITSSSCPRFTTIHVRLQWQPHIIYRYEAVEWYLRFDSYCSLNLCWEEVTSTLRPLLFCGVRRCRLATCYHLLFHELLCFKVSTFSPNVISQYIWRATATVYKSRLMEESSVQLSRCLHEISAIFTTQIMV